LTGLSRRRNVAPLGLGFYEVRGPGRGRLAKVIDGTVRHGIFVALKESDGEA
jgi:hypothetical protein